MAGYPAVWPSEIDSSYVCWTGIALRQGAGWTPACWTGAHYNIRWRGLGTQGWLVGVSNQYLKLGRDLVEICVCNYCRSSSTK